MLNCLAAIQVAAIFLKLSGALLMPWETVMAPALAFVAILSIMAIILASLSLFPDETKKGGDQ